MLVKLLTKQRCVCKAQIGFAKICFELKEDCKEEKKSECRKDNHDEAKDKLKKKPFWTDTPI